MPDFTTFPIPKTPLSTYPLLVTGGTKARTLPDRLRFAAGGINIFDFDVDPTGGNDSLSGLQTAFNQAANLTFGGQAQGCSLIFPPGKFVLGGRLKDPGTNSPVAFKGAGNAAGVSSTLLYGTNIAGYLLDCPDLGPNFTRVNSKAYLGGITVCWNSGTATACSITGDVLTVGGTITGAFTPGYGVQPPSDQGFIGYQLHILSQLSGPTGGAGDYRLNKAASRAVSSETLFCQTVWSCLRPGTTASSIPSITGKVVGDTVVDGTVTWEMVSLDVNPSTSLMQMEDMGFVNTSTTNGDGAFRCDRLGGGFFKNLRFFGFTAVHASGNQFGSVWIDCAANCSAPNGTPGSIGFMMGQASMYEPLLNGFDIGIATYGSNFSCLGGHNETNNKGVLLGMDPTGAASYAHGCKIDGMSFERNSVSIHVQQVSGCKISRNNMTGTIGPDGTTPIETGLLFELCASGGIVEGNTGGGNFSNAGYDLSGAYGDNLIVQANGVNVSGTGVKWKFPTTDKIADFTFVNNDNPISPAFPFAGLPGQAGVHRTTPIEGMQYDITDCATSGFLATAAGGGSGATAKRLVRYNAAAAAWQVIG